MLEFCLSVTTTLLSGALLFFVKEYFKLKKAQKKEKEHKKISDQEKQKDRDALLLGVTKILVTDLMMKALERGYTTQTEYEIVNDIYEPYKKSGGNGVVEHLYEHRYNTLKVKP